MKTNNPTSEEIARHLEQRHPGTASRIAQLETLHSVRSGFPLLTVFLHIDGIERPQILNFASTPFESMECIADLCAALVRERTRETETLAAALEGSQ